MCYQSNSSSAARCGNHSNHSAVVVHVQSILGMSFIHHKKVNLPTHCMTMHYWLTAIVWTVVSQHGGFLSHPFSTFGCLSVNTPFPWFIWVAFQMFQGWMDITVCFTVKDRMSSLIFHQLASFLLLLPLFLSLLLLPLFLSLLLSHLSSLSLHLSLVTSPSSPLPLLISIFSSSSPSPYLPLPISLIESDNRHLCYTYNSYHAVSSLGFISLSPCLWLVPLSFVTSRYLIKPVFAARCLCNHLRRLT